jgi:RHS repeat-associated protein
MTNDAHCACRAGLRDGSNSLVGVHPGRRRGNAENHLVTNTQAGVVTNYAYDGNGLRVKKCAPNCSSPTSSTVYIFSGSKVIAEYDNGAAPNSPSREYIYAGSQLLAKIEGSATKYYHQDHLSNRLITDSSGNVAEQKGHFPFGEDWYQGADKLKFTTYERDPESGNDYALARYHVNRLARFSSPDPVAGSLANPQSLNRYAYALSDPINLADPSGLVPPGLCAIDGNCPFALWGGAAAAIRRYNALAGWNALDLLGVAFGINGWREGSPTYDPFLFGLAKLIPLLPVGSGETGAGRGGNSSAGAGSRKGSVDQKALDDCTKQLFGVSLAAFKGSVPGGNGYFIGIGPDGRSRGGATGPIVVTNDASTYTAAQIAQIAGQPNAIGFTDPRNPYQNYGNNNNNGIGTLINQVHELGHSLNSITTGVSPLVPEPVEEGKRLEDCVRQHGGFHVQ